ncbi:HNH endonuclease [Peptostreptococcus porci]|uniref:HNH endonuclease n=1 Tax=Peptostreptococcus porci TaxID=2652282 RepID=UPI002A830148|nr:HNH endonuclease [Peptostreptococcus porci]MDY4128685.1 HNH endonuclease [Peptostreptococcus porci]
MRNKYITSKWEKKRKNILKRDDYLCVECKRKGIRRDAEMVHHINPADKYPELFLENDNLISLCNVCHNKMHNRNNNTLSKLGRKYQLLYWDKRGHNNMTKIKFVVGAPCSGKSTYVKSHMGDNDIVFDYDEISKSITNCNLHDNNPNAHKYLYEFKKIFLKLLEMENDFDTAWIVTTKMYPYYYDYFLYDPEIIFLDTTKEECIRRLNANPENRNIEECMIAIERYYDDQEEF